MIDGRLYWRQSGATRTILCRGAATIRRHSRVRGYKAFALDAHDFICERIHVFGRRAERFGHLRVMEGGVYYRSGGDVVLILILIICREDVRHRWNTVGGHSHHSISTCVHRSPQIDIFLLHKHVSEAIVVVTHRRSTIVHRRRLHQHLLSLMMISRC